MKSILVLPALLLTLDVQRPVAEAFCFIHHQRRQRHQDTVVFRRWDRSSWNDSSSCHSTNGDIEVEQSIISHSVHTRRHLIQQSTAFLTTTIATTALNTPQANGAGVVANETPYLVPTPPFTNEVSWPLGKVAFSLLPLAGTSSRRATVEECIIPDTIWTHDQIQGVVNVNVPVRQVVVRLQTGGLWVYNPVAPTPQLLKMMQRLMDQYGPIQHIVLGSVALEHKATFAAFCQQFPQATCWIQPGQWAFPLNIPIEFYGVVQRGPRLREIPIPDTPVSAAVYQYYARQDPVPAWSQDFDYEVLGPFRFRSVGGYSETVFYHKATKTLIATDCVCSVTRDPPPIIQEDPRALLYHARDSALDRVDDTIENRRKGWRRMVQFGLVFFPSQIEVRSISQAFREAGQVPRELRNLGEGAVPGTFYPWAWQPNDVDQYNFDSISQNGKLFCPPILTKLILDREPEATLAFVDRVRRRFANLERIIPCHLNNNVSCTAQEFYEAFDPLRSRPEKLIPQRALVEDLALLQKASDLFTKYGIVAPSLVCDGEEARQRGRFAAQ